MQREIDEALNAQVEDMNGMDLDIEDNLNDDNDGCIHLCMIIPYTSSDLWVRMGI